MLSGIDPKGASIPWPGKLPLKPLRHGTPGWLSPVRRPATISFPDRETKRSRFPVCRPKANAGFGTAGMIPNKTCFGLQIILLRQHWICNATCSLGCRGTVGRLSQNILPRNVLSPFHTDSREPENGRCFWAVVDGGFTAATTYRTSLGTHFGF